MSQLSELVGEISTTNTNTGQMLPVLQQCMVAIQVPIPRIGLDP